MVIILFVLLLFLSAFFSASETALLSLNKLVLKKMEHKDKKAAQNLFELLSKPKKLFFTILTGNTLVNVALSACGTAVAMHYFGDAGITLAIIVMLFLILIFGEIVPKTYAYIFAPQIARFCYFPLKIFVKCLYPVVKPLLLLTNSIISHFSGVIKEDVKDISEEEIKSLIDIGHRHGHVEDEEKEMIYGVFDFKDLRASDIMTPKPHIKAIELEGTKDEIFEQIKESKHSRLPIYKDTMDNILGIIYTKEAFLNPDKDIYDILIKPYSVPDSIKIDQLLSNLQRRFIQMAIVVNEYGVTVGVVTIEDILEEIVGEIVDEYDVEEPRIVKIDKNKYKVSGLLNINEANEEFDLDIDTEEIDTIGGFVSMHMQKIPDEGEECIFGEWRIKVLKVERRRIKELMLTRIKCL